jgi:hypothetical protein
VTIRKDGSFGVKFEVWTRRELNPFCEPGARDLGAHFQQRPDNLQESEEHHQVSFRR